MLSRLFVLRMVGRESRWLIKELIMSLSVRKTFSLVRSLLGKQKSKSRELMLKVDNIIPLWRFVTPTNLIL